MVCDHNETDLNIGIPAVMLPQDAGASLETSLQHASAGNFLFLVDLNAKSYFK